MENALRLSQTAEMRLRAIEDRFEIGTWSWEISSSVVTWSPGLYKILGVDPAVVVPSLDFYQSLVHPDDQLDFSDATGLASEKRLQDRTFRIIRPDGTLRWLRSKGQPIFDRGGGIVAMFGVAADVTESRLVEEDRKRKADLNHCFAQLLGGNLWRAYSDGRLIETTGWSKLTGESPSQARNWDNLSSIHPDDRNLFREAWSLAIETRSKFEACIRVKTVEGSYVRLKNVAVPLMLEEGSLVEWIGCASFAENVETRSGTLDIQAEQIRAARAMLGWSALQLSRNSGVSFSTVRRIEVSTENIRSVSLCRIRSCLEAEGVRFSSSFDGTMSVSLRKRDQR
ncbi:PAS domain-containing protein [Agrobacterium larrymoorei]|uniref:histidine kinase n=1 Tax=Agrobacterium larrymoorei TaxID=160699 RepID=A0ABU0UH92_9HYPH|nr:PAS domain-containing protein [Agrobacterium larrymoorei]MDQ1184318.1 PAS domain S-box-containing protein [Agrobacterium larrymoorei]